MPDARGVVYLLSSYQELEGEVEVEEGKTEEERGWGNRERTPRSRRRGYFYLGFGTLIRTPPFDLPRMRVRSLTPLDVGDQRRDKDMWKTRSQQGNDSVGLLVDLKAELCAIKLTNQKWFSTPNNEPV